MATYYGKTYGNLIQPWLSVDTSEDGETFTIEAKQAGIKNISSAYDVTWGSYSETLRIGDSTWSGSFPSSDGMQLMIIPTAYAGSTARLTSVMGAPKTVVINKTTETKAIIISYSCKLNNVKTVNTATGVTKEYSSIEFSAAVLNGLGILTVVEIPQLPLPKISMTATRNVVDDTIVDVDVSISSFEGDTANDLVISYINDSGETVFLPFDFTMTPQGDGTSGADVSWSIGHCPFTQFDIVVQTNGKNGVATYTAIVPASFYLDYRKAGGKAIGFGLPITDSDNIPDNGLLKVGMDSSFQGDTEFYGSTDVNGQLNINSNIVTSEGTLLYDSKARHSLIYINAPNTNLDDDCGILVDAGGRRIYFVVNHAGNNRGIYDSSDAKWMIRKGTERHKTFVDGFGVAAKLRGLNAAADNPITLSTSAKNVLAGQSYANLITQTSNGTASTSRIDNDWFDVNPSTGVITAKESGLFLIVWQCYFYSGYTSGDNVYCHVYKNGAQTNEMWNRMHMTNTYNTASGSHVEWAAADTTYSLMATNTTAARGTVSRSVATRLVVARLA